MLSHSLRAYLLSIHGIHHLDVNLQLIQREQHPVSTVRTPPQINQVYLSRGGEMVIKPHVIGEMYMYVCISSVNESIYCALLDFIPSENTFLQ